MATVNSRDLINQIIKNNGRYGDDPIVVKIVQYTNAWGGTAYGVIHQGESLDMYAPTDYVLNPTTLWELPSSPE